MEKLSFEDGKYQLILDAGKFTALRHGQSWRDLTGDKIVYTMFAEIQGLQAEIETLRTGYEAARLEIASLQGQAQQCGAGAGCCAQAARIEELEAQLEAVGAGGVTALMAAPAQPATPTHAGGLSEQDCGLLEQAASMLDALANDERNRGNCSTAEGADYCAHVV